MVNQDPGGLPELLDALRWRWRLLVLIVLPLVAGATVYAERLPDQFQGKAIVAVAPSPTRGDPGVVTVIAPSFVEYVTAPATIRRLAPVVGQSRDALEDAIDATLASNTGDITVTATFDDAQVAAQVANAFARELVDFASGNPSVFVTLIAPAVVPGSPSGPPRRLMEIAALLVALLVAIAAAVVVERSRPRVRSWRDIAVLTGYPVIGRLPAARALRRTAPGRALSDPQVGAAVRSLRTNLERELGGQPRGVVTVTSAVQGEGRTTVAAVLATALARLDLRVLLVDADLRAAGLSRGIRVERGGLSGALRAGGDLEGRIQPGWSEGLAVLPTRPDAEAGDLLARRFTEVVRRAREAYDVVIVDTPPLLGTDDAATVATMTDGVLLTVADGTMAAPVSEAVLSLHGLRVRVWGVVANRVREGGGTVSYSPARVGS